MSKAIGILGLVSVLFLVGCQSTRSKLAETESYLNAPSPIKLKKPVFVVIQDQRPDVERKLPANNQWLAWRYTVDRDDPNQVSLSLGKNLSETIQRKGIAHQASYGLPSNQVGTNTLVIRVNLISWYGRLENPLPLTGTLTSLLSPSHPIGAEGFCKFTSVLEANGQSIDLGSSEGQIKTSVPQNSKPSVSERGNYLSGAAVSHAMVQFFKSLEARWPATTANQSP